MRTAVTHPLAFGFANARGGRAAKPLGGCSGPLSNVREDAVQRIPQRRPPRRKLAPANSLERSTRRRSRPPNSAERVERLTDVGLLRFERRHEPREPNCERSPERIAPRAFRAANDAPHERMRQLRATDLDERHERFAESWRLEELLGDRN